MAAPVQEALLAAKKEHPRWGPKKILPYLAQRCPDLCLPAASSAGDLFARHGLTRKKRRPKWGHPGSVPLSTTAANQVWSADFKGQFKTGDGLYCFPLTVSDAHSRFLLACDAYRSTETETALATFERLFREYGLPDAIRTDNGVPFATTAFQGLSRLSLWWIKLGIVHQRIQPGHPQQNGRHERMHKTLKEEATKPPERNQSLQQQRFDAFQAEFNQVRPHEALAQKTPASVYVPSARPMPACLPEPSYPSHFKVRLVSNAGTLRIKNQQLFISYVLAKEYIGLEEVEDGMWSIYFYDQLLARFDEREGKIKG